MVTITDVRVDVHAGSQRWCQVLNSRLVGPTTRRVWLAVCVYWSRRVGRVRQNPRTLHAPRPTTIDIILRVCVCVCECCIKWHSTTPTRTPTPTPTRQTRLQSYVRHTLFSREASRGIACVRRKIVAVFGEWRVGVGVRVGVVECQL